PDPKLAQNFVQYIAEETVNMSRAENLAADRELVDAAEKRADEARLRLDQAQKVWTANAARTPVEALQTQIDAAVELRTKLSQDLAEAQADAAEYRARSNEAGGQFAREQLQAAQARVAVLDARTRELGRSIDERSATLSHAIAQREKLQTDLDMAQAAYESVSAHLRDLRAAAGTRGERLTVIDPGIVPQRPSSPNVPVNVLAALFLALTASIVYLSVAFAYRRRAVAHEPAASRRLRL
ncbi:MAG: hypothetical protein ACREH9_02025, partial [Pseudomonadota bacterium]